MDIYEYLRQKFVPKGTVDPMAETPAAAPSAYDDAARQKLYDSLANRARTGLIGAGIAGLGDTLVNAFGGHQNAMGATMDRLDAARKTGAEEFESGRKAEMEGKALERQGKEDSRTAKKDEAEMAVKLRELQLKERELANKASKPGANASEAQKTIDREFGKDYADWKLKGGYADTASQLQNLRGVQKQLTAKNGPNVTGPMLSMLPDAVRSRVLPKSTAMQQSVEESVQRTLRQTLGPQFTEKEGALFMQRGFDPRLSETENAKKTAKMIDRLDAMVKAKEAAAAYYEAHGTMIGYDGPTPQSLFQGAFDNEQPVQQTAPSPTNGQPQQAAEVKRKTKDGRIAVFDAATKKFLRYEG